MPMPHWKYRPYATVDLPDRTWPDRVVDRAPIWCSTDLRDGNQALVNPMDGGRKRRFFDLLLALGVPEIEVGFPSASKTDFDFVRLLIEERLIPDGTTIAVLTQARPELIERTFESIAGAERAIVHLYNSTSVTQRRVVFRLDKDGITDLAVRATRLCRTLAAESSTDVVLQYSPESFHHTELDYALEICEAVADEWGPTPEVEDDRQPAHDGRAVPAQRLRRPHRVVRTPLHEAGRGDPLGPPAQRSWNGGRDGRARAHGRRGARRGNALRQRRAHRQRRSRHDRAQPAHAGRRPAARPLRDRRGAHDRRGVQRAARSTRAIPYVGELVYTAFSGSHQDAIKKGMHAQERSGSDVWDVPYLPIDPKDVGRDYEAIIRVNSQSGKGGVAYLMQVDHRLELPRGLQVEFAQKVQGIADARGGRADLRGADGGLSCAVPRPRGSRSSSSGTAHSSEGGADRIAANLLVGGEERVVEGEGNGPIDALVSALAGELGTEVHVLDYHEHAMSRGEDATAAAYVEADVDGDVVWGVGIHSSIVTASLRAVLNAVNRAHALREAQAAVFDVP